MKKTSPSPVPVSLPTSESLALLNAEVERRRRAREEAAAHPPALASVKPAGEALDLSRFIDRAKQRRDALLARWGEAVNSAPSVMQCPAHPGIMLALLRENTFVESEGRGVLTPVFQTCSVCEADVRREARWRRAGVPERLLLATLDNYQTPDDETAAALAEARAFVAGAQAGRGGFFLLIGTTGTGKGHLAVGVSKLLSPDGAFTFLTHGGLLTKLRDGYGSGRTERFLDNLASVPVLTLDEYGVASTGKDEAPALYQVLAGRHDKRLPTIITTNEQGDTLRDALGFRLYDRITEDCRLSCLTGPSWRSRAR